MKKPVEKMIEELKNSPLYAMSLGGRELYHSNFWAWLMEQDKQFIKVFFPKIEIGENTEVEIEREKGNRDISITIGDKVYVIENKLKSIATIEQLEKYQDDLGDKFQQGVLTGISEDIDLKEANMDEKWQFILYSDICKGINNVLQNTADGFDKCVIEQYKKDTETVSELIQNIVPKMEDMNTWHMKTIENLSKSNKKQDDKKPTLSDIRMDDLCKKKWANVFAKKLQEALKTSEFKEKFDEVIYCKYTEKNYKLQDVRSDFTNKQPLVELFYRAEDDKNTLIGIQIQGRQYRRCFSGSCNNASNLDKTYDDLLDKTYDVLLEAKWFGDRNEHNERLWNDEPYTTNQKIKEKGEKEYCKYAPSFIYQHRTLSDSDCGIDEILKVIKADIKNAKNVLNELKS